MTTLTRAGSAPTEPDTTPTPAILARDLHLTGRRGSVYGPLDLTAAPGSLTVITGKAGSGKTALLLTLTGRLRPDRSSDLTVLGHRLPGQASAVQRRSAAVGVQGLDDLDDEVSVAATIREREAWLAPWYRFVRTPDDARVAEVCRPVFGDDDLPRARTLIHELDEAANLQLRLALAWLSRPDLLVLDDIDALHDTEGRRRVWSSLHRLTRWGTTVVVAASASSELTRLDGDRPLAHIAL